MKNTPEEAVSATGGIRVSGSERPAAIVSAIPPRPGIYIFKDGQKKVLYVGKARNLRNRVRSYFLKTSRLDPRKASMIEAVKDISYIVTENELEAFVLEASLIKQYHPKYNIVLRDDKNYPYLKLTVNEPWPGIEVVRRIKKDGSLYFGPYVPAGGMWEALSFIRRNFHIKDCRFSFDKPMRPCIQHQIGRCVAPCAGYISRDEYMGLIEEIRLFLSGERKDLLLNLKRRMEELSSEMRFEDAAKIRDRIRAIERAWETQKMISPELGDIDIIGFCREAGDAAFKVLFVRNGVMTGSREFFLNNTEDVPEGEMMQTFLTQFYAKEIIPPPEILSGPLPYSHESVSKWLGERRGGKVSIRLPQRGKKRGLLEMAQENAMFLCRSKKVPAAEGILKELEGRLGLKKTPQSIGAFDISNISGREAVGAFIWWAEGDFRKDRYRRLKIKTVEGIDDYSMMSEAIERILLNLEGRVPDLLIIDGGKGHLETAVRTVRQNRMSLKEMPEIISVAKDPDRAYTMLSCEIDLEDGAPSSLLLKGIRDEVHRFAITYHRKLRAASLLHSPLERVRGIGKLRRLELLRVFGTIDEIKNASVEEIAALKGFNRKVAEELLNELKKNSRSVTE